MNVFELAFGLVVLSLVYKLISLWMRQQGNRRVAADASVNDDLLRRVGDLEERVRVLERIVTDDGYDLKRQFKDLGA